MNGAGALAQPPPFDRSVVGLTIATATVLVERGQIRFLAQVLGTADLIHSDVEAARALGYPDLVAPPSSATMIIAAADEALRRAGEPTTLDRIGADFRFVLHGEEHYEYVSPIFAGDEVVLTTRVLDIDRKKGGTLEIIRLESELAHCDRGLLVRAKRTLIHRAPCR